MSNEEVVKVLVLGPSRSGKSTLADFLSNQRESPTSRYYETNPLRILEAEVDLETNRIRKNMNVFGSDNSRLKRARVQLWDLGGSSKHQPCWGAVAKACDGIIFVFNPSIDKAERELLLWHKQFYFDQQEVDDEGKIVRRVEDGCCLVFGHHSAAPSGGQSSDNIRARVAALKGFEKIKALETSLDYSSENFKEAFDRLIEAIMTRRAEREEGELLQRQREEADRPQMRF